MDPWLERQLEGYNEYFTDEEKEQHKKDYLVWLSAFNIDWEKVKRIGEPA